jgi:hypothetical protein
MTKKNMAWLEHVISNGSDLRGAVTPQMNFKGATPKVHPSPLVLCFMLFLVLISAIEIGQPSSG